MKTLPRAPLWRRLRCALTHHVWESTPTARGTVIALCLRCHELVVAGFVDQPEVLGLHPAPGASTTLGDASAGRTALDLVGALLEQDQAAWTRAREVATARPGQAIDSLARLSAILSLSGGSRAAMDVFSVMHETDIPRQEGTDGNR